MRPRKVKRSWFAAVAVASIVLIAVAPVQAQENPYQQLEQVQRDLEQGVELLEGGRHAEAITVYSSMIETLKGMEIPGEVRGQFLQLAHYNLACGYSLQGSDLDKGVHHFEKALEYGFTDWDHIQKDRDLDSIREVPAFGRIVSRARRGGLSQPARDFAPRQRAIVKALSKESLFDFDFDVETVQGGKVSLKELRGQVVLVDIWGTWCPPCRKAIPHLINLHKKHSDRGFAVVGLNRERMSSEEAPSAVRKFIKEHGIDYPCALASDQVIEQIPDFRAFPTFLLIDREGNVRLKRVGYTEGPVLEAAINALLNERVSPADEPASGPSEEGANGRLF